MRGGESEKVCAADLQAIIKLIRTSGQTTKEALTQKCIEIGLKRSPKMLQFLEELKGMECTTDKCKPMIDEFKRRHFLGDELIAILLPMIKTYQTLVDKLKEGYAEFVADFQENGKLNEGLLGFVDTLKRMHFGPKVDTKIVDLTELNAIVSPMIKAYGDLAEELIAKSVNFAQAKFLDANGKFDKEGLLQFVEELKKKPYSEETLNHSMIEAFKKSYELTSSARN